MPRISREDNRSLTREKLLDAAEELFAKRGYNGVSVDQVADTAGFSKGAVYSNFENKEELFLALFDRHVEREAEIWRKIFETPQTLVARMEAVKAMLTNKPDADSVWTMLELEFALYAMRGGDAREKLAHRYASIRKSMSAAFEMHFVENNLEPTMPPDELATLLFSTAFGVRIQISLDENAVSQNFWENTLNHLLGQSQIK